MKKTRVLLVEDNESVRDFYAEELEMAGYDVTAATDGAEGLKKAGAERPDVIVLDIAMPEKTGLEFLGELAGIDGSIPVIVNTAYPRFKADFRSLRAAAWLTKSSNPEELIATIARVVSEKKGNSTESQEGNYE